MDYAELEEAMENQQLAKRLKFALRVLAANTLENGTVPQKAWAKDILDDKFKDAVLRRHKVAVATSAEFIALGPKISDATIQSITNSILAILVATHAA